MTGRWFILTLWAGGCAFSNAKPATFQAAAARAATLVEADTSVRFEREISAEALVDVQPLGSGLLLDFMAEEQTKRFDVRRECGDLVSMDARTGSVQWTYPRSGNCPHRAIVREKTIIIVESRQSKAASGTVMTELDRASGTPIAAVELESVAAITADTHGVFVLEARGNGHNVIVFDEALSPRWSTPVTLTQPYHLALHEGMLYALGDTIVVLDPTSGHAVTPMLSESGVSQISAVVPHAGGLVLAASWNPSHRGVLGLARDGTVRWNVQQPKSPRVVGDGGVALASENEITFVELEDGRERWSAGIGELAGDVVLIEGSEPLLLVPQRTMLSALSAATGELRWKVPVQPGEPVERYTDRVFTGQGVIVWDTWRHIVGVDLAGAVQYAFEVRSLPGAHRENRAAEVRSLNPSAADTSSPNLAFNYSGLPAATQMAWGMLAVTEAIAHYNGILMMMTLATRRLVALKMAYQYASFSTTSDYVIRPIIWNVGRGFLLVRKSDGAFKEVFVGPSDIYEQSFREPSMAGFHSEANTLVTWSEGFASDRWEEKTRQPVKLAQRRLMGFEVDPSSFAPAASYAQSSRVPDGSYVWSSVSFATEHAAEEAPPP